MENNNQAPVIDIKEAWAVTDKGIVKGFGFHITISDWYAEEQGLFFDPNRKEDKINPWRKIKTEDLCFSEEAAEQRRTEKVKELIDMYKRSISRETERLVELENELNNAH